MIVDYINCSTPHKYCDWQTLENTPEALVEMCKFCKRKEVRHIGEDKEFKDIKGFIKDHVRDFCQSMGPTRHIFKEIYGKEKLDVLDEIGANPNKHKKNMADLSHEFHASLKEKTTFL